jgi:hypothetical protein
MLAQSSDGEMATDQQGHPVIRTLHDHVEDAIHLVSSIALSNCLISVKQWQKSFQNSFGNIV